MAFINERHTFEHIENVRRVPRLDVVEGEETSMSAAALRSFLRQLSTSLRESSSMNSHAS